MLDPGFKVVPEILSLQIFLEESKYFQLDLTCFAWLSCVSVCLVIASYLLPYTNIVRCMRGLTKPLPTRLSRMHEAGVLSRLRRKWITEGPAIGDCPEGAGFSLGLQQTLFPFKVLFVGVLISLITLIIEIVCKWSLKLRSTLVIT